MKKIFVSTIIIISISVTGYAQHGKKLKIPVQVSKALADKYPDAKKVTWEKENGNYEANWGGKSGEDNSVQFTPAGSFIEIEKAIPESKLPQSIAAYVKTHYNNAKISEAGLVTDASNKITYEVEVKGKDIIFDEKGNFIKAEK